MPRAGLGPTPFACCARFVAGEPGSAMVSQWSADAHRCPARSPFLLFARSWPATNRTPSNAPPAATCACSRICLAFCARTAKTWRRRWGCSGCFVQATHPPPSLPLEGGGVMGWRGGGYSQGGVCAGAAAGAGVFRGCAVRHSLSNALCCYATLGGLRTKR